MLVLTRKPNEGVQITDLDTGLRVGRVVVLEIRNGDTVRLGFQADRHYEIMRDEVLARMGRAPRGAAPPDDLSGHPGPPAGWYDPDGDADLGHERLPMDDDGGPAGPGYG